MAKGLRKDKGQANRSLAHNLDSAPFNLSHNKSHLSEAGHDLKNARQNAATAGVPVPTLGKAIAAHGKAMKASQELKRLTGQVVREAKKGPLVSKEQSTLKKTRKQMGAK